MLERTVEHRVNAIRLWLYNVDETALTTIKKKRKSDVEKCNIAKLIKLKCEERNRYKSNCMLCQR